MYVFIYLTLILYYYFYQVNRITIVYIFYYSVNYVNFQNILCICKSVWQYHTYKGDGLHDSIR